MKNFYNDETLGIKNEDAPAIQLVLTTLGTGDDSSTVVVKKKKLYDGRTKRSKAFMKRMKSRAKEDLNFRRKYKRIQLWTSIFLQRTM